MRKLVLIAAMLMASASAHAGNFSFNVEGQKVQVQIPRGCSSLSCINITAPGLTDKLNKDDSSSTTTATAPAPAPATTATAPTVAPAPAPAPQAVATAPAAAPTTGIAPVDASKVTVLPAPTDNTAPSSTLTAPQVSLPAPAPVAAPAPAPAQVAAAPTQVPAAPAPTQTVAANSPLGVWLTEKKEGKIRIVECGSNLCGYDIKKDGSNGSQVLHNMKPAGDKWSGRITDTRSGSNYNSTIALRGTDKLRVQGCMMMFCGGETWTRVE